MNSVIKREVNVLISTSATNYPLQVVVPCTDMSGFLGVFNTFGGTGANGNDALISFSVGWGYTNYSKRLIAGDQNIFNSVTFTATDGQCEITGPTWVRFTLLCIGSYNPKFNS